MEEKETKIEETEWLKQEIEEVKENSSFDGDRLPALELLENKNTTFTVDTSAPFQKWVDNDGNIKKIVPVSQGANRFVLWINVRNPVYKLMLEKLEKGEKEMTIFRTGTKQNTRYTLVED